jgi:glycogen operon protein
MMLAGDEFGRTQQGNNNPYCQDNEISWVNWSTAEKGKPLTDFVRKLIGLRHKYPILRRNLFLNGQYVEDLDLKDVTWINANGKEMEDEHWGDSGMRCFGMLLDGRAQITGIRQRGHEATMLLVVNVHHDLVNFVMPASSAGDEWILLIDTNEPHKKEGVKTKTGEEYGVTARSILLFVVA